ncbi:MAG: 30S ribosome-binding factor RbfA [Lentisphaeria bacterium]|nr:30S ribosome-binding factor RbfA [Lentisphaerota bacterium]MBR7143628.1 30S ribosome-binding factor RbfA [Lentisphaeria bacterium]
MTAAPDRLTRVNELIKREMSELISRYSISPSPSVLVSVTEVRTSVDLRNATVSVSVFGGDKIAQRMILENLNSSRRDFQSAMARTLGFKHTPVLTFRIDKRVAAGDRVFALLEELESEQSSGDDNE